MMQKKWIIFIISFFAVIATGLILYNILDLSKATKMDVEAVSLKEEKMQETVMAPGKLKLKDEQYVYYQGDKGDVQELLVEPGDTVDKDDELLKYKNEQLENEKEQNQLEIESLKLELDKLKNESQEVDKEEKEDSANNSIQDDDVKLQKQKTNNELEQALLEKESIEEKVDDSIVKADIAGTVLSVNEEAGSQGELGEKAIMQIGSLDEMVVKGSISEYDTLNIEKDQDVILTSDVKPDEEWHGHVSYISNLAEESEMETDQDETGVTYPIDVELDDDIDLRPGFNMLIEIVTSQQKVEALPNSAIFQEDDTNYVYIIDDDKAKQAEVTTGIVNTDKTEIKNGINKKDAVIIDPPEDLKDEMDVSVQ